MSDWQNLIQKMSRFGRLSESSKVADDVIRAMTPAMRRTALAHFVKESVEDHIRANTRAVEVASQLARTRAESDIYRRKLGEKHGVEFASLEEANRYDDEVAAKLVKEKRAAEESRRQEIAKSLLEELHIQWSSELLNASFKLGDGSSTTWGEATISQHEARIEMMTKNIIGNAETMKRHEAAVIALAGSGAPCLNQIKAEVSDG